MLLGCIGDDFTGSSDLANTLVKQGMQVTQYVGVPDKPAFQDVEAGVIALKSRSIDPNEAVSQSLEALKWLQAQGCRQFYFKYCSTFDSRPEGNIGPVAEALAAALDADMVIVCPAFPGAKRTVYQGHLFVADKLLNESGMQNHPITPMTDSDIRRWLSLQTTQSVGHVGASAVLNGVDAIKRAFRAEHDNGQRFLVVDALRDADLYAIGEAAKDLTLLTGGSGLALGLPANFARRGLISTKGDNWVGQTGKCVALSGSCSEATRAQVNLHKAANPSFEIIADDVIQGHLHAKTVSDWLLKQDGVPLAFSSADPDVVRKVQGQHGGSRSSNALEGFFAEVARLVVAGGVTKIITAGGETSGSIVEGLKIKAFKIGPEIDPGVPALRADSDLVMALKSGNFGAPDFFDKAAKVLAGENL